MISLILALLVAGDAEAFPQLTRHNYFNCTTCHVSPSGGGDLTEYGRGLSGELLSMRTRENEAKPFWNLVPDSSVITPSAFVRVLQFYTDSDASREAKAILMQLDLGASIKAGPVTAVGSVGRRRIAPAGAPVEHQIFSRTHYLLYSAENGINARAGKFLVGYGLNHPNHNLFIRRDTGLGNDTERYNAELSYLGDGFSILGTAIFGPGADHHSRSKEEGGTLSVNKSIGESSRLGASYYKASSQTLDRELAGLYGVMAYTEKLYSQFELDRLQITATRNSRTGFIFSHQLGWEVVQGITPYLEQQWEKLDLNKSSTIAYVYALGANFYPRPHFEITAAAGREHRRVFPTTFFAYAMLNLYL